MVVHKRKINGTDVAVKAILCPGFLTHLSQLFDFQTSGSSLEKGDNHNLINCKFIMQGLN